MPGRGCLRRGLINSAQCRSRFLRAPLFRPGNIYRAPNKRRRRLYCGWCLFSRLIYHCHVCSFLPSAFLSPGNAVISFIIGHYIMHSVAASVVIPRPAFSIQTQFCNQGVSCFEAEPCRDTCTLSLEEEEKPPALRGPNLRIGLAKLPHVPQKRKRKWQFLCCEWVSVWVLEFLSGFSCFLWWLSGMAMPELSPWPAGADPG